MKTARVTVAVILDSRRTKDNGLYPLKLRITHDGERKYYTLKEDCSVETWNEVLKPKGGGERIRLLRSIKSDQESNANKVIDRMQANDIPFSLFEFDKRFVGEAATVEGQQLPNDVYACIDAYALKLKGEDRMSSGDLYESMGASVRRFHGKKRLTFGELTTDFLKRYHKFMEVSGGRNGTGQRAAGIGIYMRNLRCIVNQAVTAKLITPDAYPFGKGKYLIPTGGNIKKALPIEAVRALRDYTLPESGSVARYRDLWYFSYLCNGMNMKDVALLQWSDIDGDIMHFIRAKTSRTVKEQKPIRVILNEHSKAVINRWGNVDRHPNAYVFGILQPSMTARQVRDKVQNTTKYINKAIRKVAGELGITAPITTYWARHSWATQMLKNNANPIAIKDGLGHTTFSETTKYTDGISEVEARQLSNSLV